MVAHYLCWGQALGKNRDVLIGRWWFGSRTGVSALDVLECSRYLTHPRRRYGDVTFRYTPVHIYARYIVHRFGVETYAQPRGRGNDKRFTLIRPMLLASFGNC